MNLLIAVHKWWALCVELRMDVLWIFLGHMSCLACFVMLAKYTGDCRLHTGFCCPLEIWNPWMLSLVCSCLLWIMELRIFRVFGVCNQFCFVVWGVWHGFLQLYVHESVCKGIMVAWQGYVVHCYGCSNWLGALHFLVFFLCFERSKVYGSFLAVLYIISFLIVEKMSRL